MDIKTRCNFFFLTLPIVPLLTHLQNIVKLVVLLVLTQTNVFKTESGHVEFDSTVPLHSFTGASDQLTGKINLNDSTVDFYVDVHTLKTGIGMRDDDMLETMEAEKYPFAEFYGKLVSNFNPKLTEPQKVTVKGDMTIHGITKPVEITGTLQKTDEGLKVNVDWTLNMKDYSIKPPGILFYRVSKKIDVSISATLPPIKNN